MIIDSLTGDVTAMKNTLPFADDVITPIVDALTTVSSSEKGNHNTSVP